ncbi:PREDICTED: uronyl 2-sulfotransferase [Gekko japonicus]|uniref:Uronyl 2-sulfotransferase n=1 Tax=Gekko japonicus TaxID=146911 RepID=A0ABM1KBF0_GEKJA|nr:PREDICTED: uronyl 2-sulfotransferase [Gekko japonicus]
MRRSVCEIVEKTHNTEIETEKAEEQEQPIVKEIPDDCQKENSAYLGEENLGSIQVKDNVETQYLSIEIVRKRQKNPLSCAKLGLPKENKQRLKTEREGDRRIKRRKRRAWKFKGDNDKIWETEWLKTREGRFGNQGTHEERRHVDMLRQKRNSTYMDEHGPPPRKVLPFPSQVVYNRVGKCGSRTVVLLLRILSEKHGFNLVTSDIHNKTRLTKNEQMELIKNISTAEQPYLFTRHVHFLNFSRFGGDQPVYINIIRDPINRFLSNYFFRRFGDWRGEQNHMIRTPSMRQEERYLDINVCILENYPECSNPRLFYIIPYFCGQHPRCREPGEWALERAKVNVNENFLLVGILEELEDVLLLLERFLPHYFKDVLSIYKNPEHRKLGNLTVTVKKTVPSPEAIQILYQRMKYEYEFYYYVKEQFHLYFAILSPLETEEPITEDEEQDDEKWLEDIYKR